MSGRKAAVNAAGSGALRRERRVWRASVCGRNQSDWLRQRKIVTLLGADVTARRRRSTQWRDDEGRLLDAVLAAVACRSSGAAAIASAGAAAEKRDDSPAVVRRPAQHRHTTAPSISGIERFQQRQKARAAEIERARRRNPHLKEKAANDEKARAELAAPRKATTGCPRLFPSAAVASARLRGACADRTAAVRARAKFARA